MNVPAPSIFGGTAVNRNAPVRQRGQAGEVLDDRDARRQQDRVHRPLTGRRAVDVQRVDPDARDVGGDEGLGGRGRQVRMVAACTASVPKWTEWSVRTSTACPASPANSSGVRSIVAMPRRSRQTAGTVGHPLEREPGEIVTVRVAVERHVEIRAGVRAHRDEADVERRAWCVQLLGGLARQVGPDDGTGNPGYVSIPSVIRWLRSISCVPAFVAPMSGDGSPTSRVDRSA